jgi:hypothetical protein
MAKNIILEVSLDRAKIAKDILDTQKDIENLNKNIVDTRKKLDDAVKAGDTKTEGKLRKELVLLNSDLRQLTTEQKNYNKQLDLINKANAANAGSYEQLLRQQQIAQTNLKLLAGTLKQNADGTIELTEEYLKAAEQVREAKEAIIAFDQEIKDGRTNVGNYAESIKEAFEQTGLFGGAIGNVRNVVQGFKSVTSAVVDTTKGISDSVNGAIDSFSNWISVTNDASGTFSTFTSGVEGVSTTTETVSEGLETLGDASDKFGDKGSGAFKKVRVAMIASGIGAIVLAIVAAIGALVAYFTKTEEGAEKLEQAFAGVSAVFDVIIGAVAQVGGVIVELFTNFDEAIKKISFDNVVSGFKNLFSDAKEAAKGAVDLKKREQELEDARRDSILTQKQLALEAGNLRKIEQDKTKTTAERLDASKKASEKEKQILQEQIKFQQEEVNVILDRNKALEKSKTLRDEDSQKAIDAQVKLMELQDQFKNKDANDQAERSKLLKAAQQEEISARVGILNNNLKQLELEGKATVELRKEIAAKERQAALLASDLSAAERLKIESDYQTKLLEIDKNATDARNNLLQQTEDIRNARILDGRSREIAIELSAVRRKLDAIKGTSKEEEDLRAAIATESALKIVDIEKKYADLSAKERLDIIKNNASIQQGEINSKYKAEEDALRLSLSNQLITQQQFENEMFKIKERRLQDELNVALQTQGARQAEDKKFFDTSKAALDKQLADKKISEKEYNDGITALNKDFNDRETKTEVETQATITNLVNGLQQLRLDNQVANNTKRVANTDEALKREQELLEISTQNFLDVSAFIGDTLGQLSSNEQARFDQSKDALKQSLDDQKITQEEYNKEVARIDAEAASSKRKFAIAQKAISVAEILVNLNKELSAIALYASLNPLNAVTAGGAGAATYAAQSTAAYIRAGIGVAKVLAQKFADGGLTSSTDSLFNVVDDYSPTNVGTFANGGMFSRPSIGLIGEAGTELVIRNSVLRQEPAFFSALERWNRTGVRPFADGGFTSSTISAPIFDSDVLAQGIATAVASMPSPVVTVEDINTVSQRVQIVESRANL